MRKVLTNFLFENKPAYIKDISKFSNENKYARRHQ